MQVQSIIATLNETRPILISGATASGKSALALEIAAKLGGVIVNADALQVYSGWRILTARPSLEDESHTKHMLYGHIGNQESYSVGEWMRQITPILKSGQRPIIVGGTGLYFMALTKGLADIPKVPTQIQLQAKQLLCDGKCALMLAALDSFTRSKIDIKNPMRVSRAWQVLQATGKSIATWHAQTPPPLLPLTSCNAFHLRSPTNWLNIRLENRFNNMISAGALEEARSNLDKWDSDLQSSRAIGAPELINHLLGKYSLIEAKEMAITASRQYAKRQRTWFRKHMSDWLNLESHNL